MAGVCLPPSLHLPPRYFRKSAISTDTCCICRLLTYEVIWGHLVGRLKLDRSLSRRLEGENSTSGSQPYSISRRLLITNQRGTPRLGSPAVNRIFNLKKLILYDTPWFRQKHKSSIDVCFNGICPTSTNSGFHALSERPQMILFTLKYYLPYL